MLLVQLAMGASFSDFGPVGEPVELYTCDTPVPQEFHGMAVGDIDLDGDDDLFYSLHMGPPQVLRNDGGGVLSSLIDALPVPPPQCDADDKMDAPGTRNAAYLLLGDVHMGNVVDVDGDSYPELYAAAGANNATCCGASTLWSQTSAEGDEDWRFANVLFGEANELDASTRYGLWLDYDLDGMLDLFTGHAVCISGDRCDPTKHRHRLWRNMTYPTQFLGKGYGQMVFFEEATPKLGESPLADDDNSGSGLVVDLDGLDIGGTHPADIIVTGRWAKISSESPQVLRWYRGDGTGFVRHACPTWTKKVVSIAAGDVNEDGYVDLLYGTENGKAALALSAGGLAVDPCVAAPVATFATPVSGTVVADFDNDAHLDLFVGYEDALYGGKLCPGDGSGSFPVCEDLALPAAHELSALPSDLDGDGMVDLLVAGAGDAWAVPHAIVNTLTNPNHWYQVRPQGAAIGARVTVTDCAVPATTIGTHWVQSGGGYLASLGPSVHVGLGARTTACLEILWPDGAEAAVASADWPVDQCLRVEPSGVVSAC